MSKKDKGHLFCKLTSYFTDKIFTTFIDYINHIDYYNKFNIYGVGDNFLKISLKGEKVFGFEVANQHYRVNELTTFASDLKEFKQDTFTEDENSIIVSFVKNDIKRAVYVFGKNENLIKKLAEYFRVPLASGQELLNYFFDIFQYNKYVVDRANRLVKESEFTEDIDQILAEIKDGVKKKLAPTSELVYGTRFAKIMNFITAKLEKDYIPFQGVSHTLSSDFNIYQLFKTNWKGSILIYLNFEPNYPYFIIDKYYREALLGDFDTTKKLKDLVQGDNAVTSEVYLSNYCVINSLMILDKESSGRLSEIKRIFNIDFVENYYSGFRSFFQLYLGGFREIDFDEIIDYETAKKFLRTFIKKPFEKPDFWAYDLTNGYVDFQLTKYNNPHMFIGGQTGAGKSVSWLNFLTRMLSIDLENKNFESPVLGTIRKVRYCDVGYTAGTIVEQIKDANTGKVKILSSKFSNLRYSIFDIKRNPDGTPDVEELEFLVNYLTIAIEADSKGKVTFESEEKRIFVEAYTDFAKDENNITNFSLRELEKRGYEKECKELYEKYGLSPMSSIKDIPKESKYAKMFRYPTLEDFILYLEERKAYPETSKADALAIEKLIPKMKIIQSYNIFNDFTNIQFEEDFPFFYIDFNEIKNNKKMFIVIFWLLFRKWLERDMEEAAKDFSNKRRISYVIEEAHNFFSIPSFSEMLRTVTKELRKFGGELVFISQEFSDIPESILSQLSVVVFVYNKIETNIVADMMKKQFNLREEQIKLFHVVDIESSRPIFVKTSEGVSLCYLKIKPELLEYFKPKKIDG